MIKYLLFIAIEFSKSGIEKFDEIQFKLSVQLSMIIYFHLLLVANVLSGISDKFHYFYIYEMKDKIHIIVLLGFLLLAMINGLLMIYKKSILSIIENTSRNKSYDKIIKCYIIFFWFSLIFSFWV